MEHLLLHLPADVVYLLILCGLLLGPVALGYFVSTSKMIAPGLENWYATQLSEEELTALEANLDHPLPDVSEEWDNDDEYVEGEIIMPRGEKRWAKYIR